MDFADIVATVRGKVGDGFVSIQWELIVRGVKGLNRDCIRIGIIADAGINANCLP
jgi:hypothetical protein